MGAKGSGGFHEAVKEHVRPVRKGGSGVRRKRDDEEEADVNDDGGVVDGGGARKKSRVETLQDENYEKNGKGEIDEKDQVEAVTARRRYKRVQFRQGAIGIKGDRRHCSYYGRYGWQTSTGVHGSASQGFWT